MSTKDELYADDRRSAYRFGLDCRADEAEHIRSHQASPPAQGPLVYTILLVPRVTELCRKVLEDEGVAGDVTLSEVCLYSVTYDSN